MNMHRKQVAPRAAVIVAALALMTACATNERAERPSELDRIRAELNALQSDPQLAGLAPIALREAEQAVQSATNAEEDTELREHLVFVAEQRVDIAEARAMRRYYENSREDLRDARDRLRLEARTMEAERARQDARTATMQAIASQEENQRLKRELEDMNAKQTDRGVVLTLRDVLFDLNEYTLKPGGQDELDRLAEFLKEYPNRDVQIQGHTDSTGDESYNMQLSQRRADAVKEYLVSQGIQPNRIRTTGRGESVPLASNETPGGRQINRRVEIVIENPVVASR